MIQEEKIRKVLQPAESHKGFNGLGDVHVVLLPGSTMSPETRFYFTIQFLDYLKQLCEVDSYEL